MKHPLNLYWFRQDLRLGDNPGFTAALKQGPVLLIYILDDGNAAPFARGGASRWWLHHSLQALNQSLGGKLNLYHGDPKIIIDKLCRRFTIKGVYWNRCYEPWRIERDKTIKSALTHQGVKTKSYNTSLLREPWTIQKKDNQPYKTFAPFYRQASTCYHNVTTLNVPDIHQKLHIDNKALSLKALKLLPSVPWDSHFSHCWLPGESGAQKRLSAFLTSKLDHYNTQRDFPAKDCTSKLSPHLHFGEISPGQVVKALLSTPDNNNREHFIKELAWREFSYYLLFHNPNLPTNNLKCNLDDFPWQNNQLRLKRWQQGQTGYPLVDAGMRELWQTGFMHNRVRMIAASFLVKNLMINWQHGASWFWDCLVDADLASNSAGWQWVAGCGTDAAPYFRIFNPTTQGERFDPTGAYTRHYLPELKNLPDKYLFSPWGASSQQLSKANVILGKNYPLPIVDTKASRLRALNAFESIKKSKKTE